MGSCTPKPAAHNTDPLRLKKVPATDPMDALPYVPKEEEVIMSKHNEIVVTHMKKQQKAKDHAMTEDELRRHIYEIFEKYDSNSDGIMDL